MDEYKIGEQPESRDIHFCAQGKWKLSFLADGSIVYDGITPVDEAAREFMEIFAHMYSSLPGRVKKLEDALLKIRLRAKSKWLLEMTQDALKG